MSGTYTGLEALQVKDDNTVSTVASITTGPDGEKLCAPAALYVTTRSCNVLLYILHRCASKEHFRTFEEYFRQSVSPFVV